jgi:hypothetical protein
MTVDVIKRDAQFIYDAGMNLMSFLGARNLLPPFPTSLRFRGHKTKAARKKRRKAKLGERDS